jgi:prepilin-type N-terminal cleavage/methylation domain-containing protein
MPNGKEIAMLRKVRLSCSALFCQPQSGFSLLEVLITIFILSFGLLALLQLQCYTANISQQNWYQLVAQTQLQSLAEKLSISPVFSNAISAWNNQNQLLLPSGNGQVINNDSYLITIGWSFRKKQSLQLRVKSCGN